MATNFPTSQDSFTNPSSGSSLSSPSHSQQHSDVNDAVEAIEGALLDGAPLHIDDANERVGIGTTSPAVKLHVDSGSTAQFAAPQIYVAPSGHASSDRAAIQLDDIQLLTDIAGNGAEDFSIYSNTAGAHRLSIDSSGNVGVNDFSPSYTLDVDGDINATGDLRIGGTAVGKWTSFTPTFNGLSLGASGATAGMYAEINDLVFYNAKFDLGGTGSVSGHITLQPPVGTCDNTTTYPTSHQGWVRPSGSSIYQAMGFSSGSDIYFYSYTTSGSRSGATAVTVGEPATWTSNGIGYFAGWYAKA